MTVYAILMHLHTSEARVLSSTLLAWYTHTHTHTHTGPLGTTSCLNRVKREMKQLIKVHVHLFLRFGSF